jgi:hypothetical protein
MKMRLAISKGAFNTKISLLTSKLNTSKKKNSSAVIFGELHCMAQRPEH